MNDDAEGAAVSAPARTSAFMLRRVPQATATERLMREEGMARSLRNGARPYRDVAGKGRHIPFKEANLAPVEPRLRDPRAKRGYRRTQELRKAAGQLIGQPGDRIEIAKRLGELHWEQGSDIEGAARRGLYDAIWSREHVVPNPWSGLVGEGADFYDPLTNIRAGVTLVRRLLDRIEEPTVAKVASPFKFTGREFVSDYGARVAEVYASRAWERKPEPSIYPETDKPVEWRPENEGYGRRREELKKRLAEGGAQERVLDDPLWGNASP